MQNQSVRHNQNAQDKSSISNKSSQSQDDRKSKNSVSSQQHQSAQDVQQQKIQTNQVKYPELEKNKQSQYNKLQGDIEFQTKVKTTQGQQHSQMIIEVNDQIDMFPNTYLEPSPKGFKPIQIKIQNYKTAIFLKIQTQIFVIDIINQSKHENYQIERRFSDFSDLYEAIFYNHPGYILHPFPGKNLDSFIKIKLGLGNTDANQRYQMIQKRMHQLQDFINYVTHHPQLSNSQQLNIFLMKNTQNYEQQRKRIQKYTQQYKSLEKTPDLINFIGKGFEFIKQIGSSNFTANKNTQKTEQINFQEDQASRNAVQFAKIYTILREKQMDSLQITDLVEKLYNVQKKFGQFYDMETDIDTLLKVCAKHSSSRDFCKTLSDKINLKIIIILKKNNKIIEQIQKNLMYRLQIIGIMKDAKNKQNIQKFQKLQRRLDRIQHNFMVDWLQIIEKLNQSQQQAEKILDEEWKLHKKSMCKVWKDKS